ncbi:MAG: hypothetical protein JRJ84_03945 [Deltaproteobacteria bacterium]|nr:hypothetical protein [Deltaproteobacteria bacterium]
MRVVALLVLLMAVGCEQIEPSGDVLGPVVEAAPAPVMAPAEEPPPEEFDFEADERVEDDVAPRELDPEALAASLGIEVLPEVPPAEDVVADVGEPEVVEVAIPEVEAEAEPEVGWGVDVPMEGSWGVRVVAVLSDAQPPRAIVGLSDGREITSAWSRTSSSRCTARIAPNSNRRQLAGWPVASQRMVSASGVIACHTARKRMARAQPARAGPKCSGSALAHAHARVPPRVRRATPITDGMSGARRRNSIRRVTSTANASHSGSSTGHSGGAFGSSPSTARATPPR